ncbi:hypothetical protein L1987_08788 [Smallanthus sonchifolius]|uniref:Uncharacterized protein n=1 Tax=Smallanthus sonchifolius TaxID=185202 RepID=A0ACB9JLK6_9ASTR|nr:hypothetical protein L1987_08788 [Smallanthus sonchifolius]
MGMISSNGWGQMGEEGGCVAIGVSNGVDEVVDLMIPGTTGIIRNGKIDIFKGSMRLAVDKWGCIEVTAYDTFEVKEDINLSRVQYEQALMGGGRNR